MKRLFIILSCILCGILVHAQNERIVLEANSAKNGCMHDTFEKFSAAFSFESIEGITVNTEKGNFTRISIEGAFPTGHEGAPQLPAFRKLIAIPQGATPKVFVKSYTEEEFSLTEKGWDRIYPNQPSVRKDQRPEDVKFIYQEKAYASKGYEERIVAHVEELGTMRNMRIGALTINPVVYDAGTNKIKIRNNIEVEVSFEGADKAATQNLFESTYSIYFEPVYQQFLNRNVYEDHPDLYQTPVHMLVIANRMFEETLQPWIEWKTKKGFYMDVNYTDNIGTTYSSIQSFVANKYNEGIQSNATPTFLVIVGDVAQVPNTTGNSSQKVTDLYYASIDGDYFPDMYGSRMCCETTTELASLIEKILVYEQATMEDPSYLGNALLIAGADGNWNPRVGQSTINYATTNYFNTAHGYNNVYAYLTSYSGCYNHLSTGVAFANYTAHGGETSWADPSFTVSNVASLTNYDKYFLAVGNCCVAANFGYSSVCFGEAMIRANQKGAYSYIGSCPNTYWYEDYYWSVGANNSLNSTTPPPPESTSTGAYDAAFMEDVYNTVASTMFIGNLAVCYAHDGSYSTHSSPLYYWQAYHVLGDGSIMPHYGMPTENMVSHLPVISIGLDFYEVSADPGSYVAVSKEGVLHGAALVGETGTVQVPLNPPITSGGNVDIVVTCPQRFPYMTQVPAAALEGAYITVDGYTLDGDGILGYGETAKISIDLKNVGIDATSGGITVTLSCDDPLITIVNGTATCGTINAEEIVTITDAFEITVSSDIENKQSFTLNVVSASGSDTWEGRIKITAYKPILEFEGFEWSGTFEPGSSLFLSVSLQNVGGIEVHDVMGTLSSLSEYVTINAAEQNFETIPVNETAATLYNVNISENIPSGEKIKFTIVASGDSGSITGEGSFTLANTCIVVFDMYDSSGDGWDNTAALRLSFSDGSPDKTIKLNSGSFGQEKVEMNKGVDVTMTWIYGNSYDYECSFKVSYEDGTLIYQSSGVPSGILHTFTVDCECQSGTTCDYTIENLKGEAGSGEASVILSWDAVASEENVFYAVYKDGTFFASTQNNEITDMVDGPETEYIVSVVCENFIESDQVSVTVYFCDPMQDLSYEFLGTGVEQTLILNWIAPGAEVENYEVYKNGEYLSTMSGTENSYEIIPAENGLFCIKPNYTSECGQEEACIEVTGAVNIANIDTPFFTIYPNPIEKGEKITIQLSGNNMIFENGYIHIYDMLGRMIDSYSITSESMNISTPKEEGVYIIRIISENKKTKNQVLIVK